jgi:hypothetical protein
MKRLALLCLLALSACGRLPTETASRAPTPPRADGGMTMGGGQRMQCTDANGETVPCR